MNIIYFLLPMALLMGGGFVVWFIVSVYTGQYDDLETPAHRMLLDDETSSVEKSSLSDQTQAPADSVPAKL